MSNDLDRLRKAVDVLTIVQTVDIRQERDGVTSLVKADSEPLIKQLREAVASSIAASGAGSSLASERNMLNSEAMELYDRIEDAAISLLGQFAAEVPYLTPEQNIRQASVHIHKEYQDGKLDDIQLFIITKRLELWANQINAILNPPTTLELMGSGHECEQSHAKLNDSMSGRALIIEWHNPDHGFVNALHNCVAKCRNCHKEWRGDLKLRELAYVLETDLQPTN